MNFGWVMDYDFIGGVGGVYVEVKVCWCFLIVVQDVVRFFGIFGELRCDDYFFMFVFDWVFGYVQFVDLLVGQFKFGVLVVWGFCLCCNNCIYG